MAPIPKTNAMSNILNKRPTPEEERIRELQLSMIRSVKGASIAMERLTKALSARSAAFQKAFNKELQRKPRAKNRSHPNV